MAKNANSSADAGLLTCFVCEQSDCTVKNFKEATLRKCERSLSCRIYHGLVHADKELPQGTADGKIGYHSTCYSNFNALNVRYRSVRVEPCTSTVSNDAYEHSANSSIANAEENLIEHEAVGDEPELSTEEEALEKSCFFCPVKYKRKNGKVDPFVRTKDYKRFTKVKQYATEKEDFELLNRLAEIVKNENILAYHSSCALEYRTQYLNDQKRKGSDTAWSLIRDKRGKAYRNLKDFIIINIVEKRKSFFFSFLQNIYIQCLYEEIDKSSRDIPNAFSVEKLKERINSDEELKDRIAFFHSHKKLVVGPKDTDLENFDFEELSNKDIIQRAAILIRREILDLKKKDLPEKLTATALIEGECETPPNLANFYKALLSGGNSRRRKCADFKRKCHSLAQDAIYNVTTGRVKTSKHITLGMAMKSLTSSKIVVDILNSFGHCCSYSTLLGFETEATYTCVQSSQISPHDIRRIPNLNTGLAYDNFDRFVETLDGRDTLHDTVGIVYQDIYIPPDDDTEPPESNVSSENPTITSPEREDDSEVTLNGKRRRGYQGLEKSLEECYKRPGVERKPKSLDFQMRYSGKPANYQDLQNLHSLWIFSFFMGMKTPMCVGFNSEIIEDRTKKQMISYLTPLNSSPTEDKVVLETLKQAQRVAEECGDDYVQITYDLAIALKAMNIQKSSESRFSNVFIHLGSFHIIMSYFKALGKFIDGSGITDILVDSGILANGSVSSFLSGKHFHRGKRLHPLMAVAFEIIHFRYFMKCEENLSTTIDNNKDDVVKYLETFRNTRCTTPRVENEVVLEILRKYQEFRKETVEGKHGKTGQFCLIYSSLVSHYIELTTAIRTGNFDLFVYILPKICNLLFSFNHQNYSRWLVQYHDNLISVDETHPGLIESFRAGSFGIKRTDKPFSRIPVDLTLEQTINADAARSLTGISHFTNSLGARQRWSISHGVRTSILSYVYDITGVKRKHNVTKELTTSRIKKDNNHIFKFIDGINERLNPFSTCIREDKLYNLSTGVPAPDNIENFLLNIMGDGEQLRRAFTEECIDDDKRFDKPIKRVLVENFATLKTKKKLKVTETKAKQVTVQRDLFGRLLAISLENSVDLAKIMRYPITPSPAVFCHIDGTLYKTNKSVLVKTLEAEVDDSFAPPIIDHYIVDGFFFLYSVKNSQCNFGKISLQILEMLCSLNSQKIDIVFDTYPQPSIKDTEHALRENLSTFDGVINERLNLRNSNFTAHLKDKKFKQKFVEFLSEHWTCKEAAKIIGGKVINLNFTECFEYRTSLGQVIKSRNYDLNCEYHEEADTKIVYHASKNKKNVVIKCSDTDILVILLANMNEMEKSTKIWMEMGVGNKRRFINVSKLYETLGCDLAHSLLGFHAFTGCDFNPCFHQKGKKKPFNLLKKFPEFQQAFSEMSGQRILRGKAIYENTLKTIQKYVCQMYGLRNLQDVDEGRLAVFSAAYMPKKKSEKLLKELHKYDSSRLPPCLIELKQQFRRSIYIAQIWGGAHLKVPTDLEPSEWGWVLEDGKLNFYWFDGFALPEEVQDVILPESITEGVSDENNDETPEISDSDGEDSSEDGEGWSDDDDE